MNIRKKTFQFGDQEITFETGRVARQATAAVLVTMGDNVVLVTVVAKKTAAEGQGFFPLTVNYQEKTYAGGKIPGGYFKREGRPAEAETLKSRLIDRTLRPLFPDGFLNEVQVIATVMSTDCQTDMDILAMLGAAAAMSISGVPFEGPIAGCRVGYADGQYLLNPNYEALETSQLDLVISGSETAVLMVESEAKELAEDIMLGALRYGHEQLQAAIKAIKEFAADVATPAWDWQPAPVNTSLQDQIAGAVKADLEAAYDIQDKQSRYEKVGALKEAIVAQFVTDADDSPSDKEVGAVFGGLEKDIVRGRILANQPRIDGRDTKTVRPISIELGVLPRAHGSALFTRGETQAIVAVTLGTDRDGQIIDALSGEYRDTFMLHYNFPPYCVGECGFMSGPKRREIGHGRLARRGVTAALPSQEEFPYVLRAVSEITESNGSSSMATVCGTSLAMMDAGVPTKAHVAGIAMGLIKEGDQFAVLTDILGDEDHLGDMDFKVAGTTAGVTALQMDIKINGITFDIMEKALAQAGEGRHHILGLMKDAITGHRPEISQHAPIILEVQIRPEQIREVIGKGGETIKSITEATETTIDITDDGLVKIAAVNRDLGQEAVRRVKEITTDIEPEQIYEGRVAKIMDFGAFVNLKPGKDGLVHVSQIANERVNDVSDYLEEGQMVKVKVLEVDRQGKIKLSMKALLEVE